MPTVTVLGGGSYGTALACIAAKVNPKVIIYVRDTIQADTINQKHYNPKRFSSQTLPLNIEAITCLESALAEASLIIHAIPSQATFTFFRTHRQLFRPGIPILCTSKGIDAKKHIFMIEIIKLALAEKSSEIPLGVLSGPSFAKEIISGETAGVVVASKNITLLKKVVQVFKNSNLKISTTDDIIGVEIGGALKNPLAIGTGIARGLEMGESTIAFLVTLGSKEMRILANAWGGRPETLSGLSGVGDLMLTCFSKLSRNNRFGEKLAQGLSVKQAGLELGEVVEGVATCQEIIYLADKSKVSKQKIPFFYTVYLILKEKLDCRQGINKLLNFANGTTESFI